MLELNLFIDHECDTDDNTDDPLFVPVFNLSGKLNCLRKDALLGKTKQSSRQPY